MIFGNCTPEALMKTFHIAMLAAAMAAAPACAQAPIPPADAAQIIADRIDRDGQGVGMATAIVEGGEPQFASHGVLTAGGGAPVDETTLFEAGSLSKIFTATLLAHMVAEGRMALDRPVADYLPEGIELPAFDGQEMTVFDLATQSSGLPAIPPEMAFADPANPYQHYDAELFQNFLSAYELQRAPGSQYEYSNTGFALLGMALSHIGGAPYETLVSDIILEPLGMDDTMLDVPGDKQGRLATAHDAGGKLVPHWAFDVFAPAGGYRSTAEDLAKFVAAASGQVASPLEGAFGIMLDRTRPAGEGMSIGLGWLILATPNGGIVGHNGKTAGSNAFMGFARDGSRAAVVLANMQTQTGIEDIGFHLIDPEAPLAPQPAAAAR